MGQNLKRALGGHAEPQEAPPLPNWVERLVERLQLKMEEEKLRQAYAHWNAALRGGKQGGRHAGGGGGGGGKSEEEEEGGAASRARFEAEMRQAGVQGQLVREGLWRSCHSLRDYLETLDTLEAGDADARLGLVFRMVCEEGQVSQELVGRFVEELRAHVPVLVGRSGPPGWKDGAHFAQHLWRVCGWREDECVDQERFVDGCYNSQDIVALLG